MSDNQQIVDSIQGLQVDLYHTSGLLVEMLDGIRHGLIDLNEHLKTVREESQALKAAEAEALKAAEKQRCHRIIQALQRSPYQALSPECLSGGHSADEVFLTAVERLESEGHIIWRPGLDAVADEDVTGQWVLLAPEDFVYGTD